MVCVYGMSHVPALLLLDFPQLPGQERLFGVLPGAVVQTCMVVQHLVTRGSSRTAKRAPSARASTGALAHRHGVAGGLLGGLLSFITPFKPGQALGMAFDGLRAGLAGPPGDEGAQARPRRAPAGARACIGHRRQWPAGPGGRAVLCCACVLSLGALVFRALVRMRILGIDPGLQTTGFGVVDADGHALTYVASGTITHHPPGHRRLPARLKVLFDGICEVVQRYEPDVSASVEIVFVNVNPQATCCWARHAAPA
jgi:hypothetical protein